MMASSADDSSGLGPALPILMAAAELGGRAEAAGDPAGALGLYACAARLARKVRGLGEVADFRLERAQDEADGRQEPAARAAVFRSAFDSLLPDNEPATAPDDPLTAAQRFIDAAISIGAPAYNLDDHQGCYDVYACTARMILATLSGADSIQAPLREALNACGTIDDPNKQAWAMRHAFDTILGLGGASGPSIAPGDIRQLLAMAIRIGAPAFNLGDSRGCFEVYACTARLLLHGEGVPNPVKTSLRQALEQAAIVPDVARQAWILRHTFDALLGGDPANADAEEDSDESPNDTED